MRVAMRLCHKGNLIQMQNVADLAEPSRLRELLRTAKFAVTVVLESDIYLRVILAVDLNVVTRYLRTVH